MVVIDASIALAWCFDDELTEATDALLDRVRDEGAITPGLWRPELGNVLLQAQRRGRIAAEDVARRLDLFAALPISTDPETTQRAWGETLTLARAERLTPYDASYLELAIRRGAPLLTLDEDLARAARRRDVTVAP